MRSRPAVLLALPLAARGTFFGGPTRPEALRHPIVVMSHDGVLELTPWTGRHARPRERIRGPRGRGANLCPFTRAAAPLMRPVVAIA
jgi:hypothetical protein